MMKADIVVLCVCRCVFVCFCMCAYMSIGIICVLNSYIAARKKCSCARAWRE